MERQQPFWYDTALLCRNGHVINKRLGTHPGPPEPHCKRCGAETIDRCLNCNAPIQGDRMPTVLYHPPFEVPAHCHACGKPYPWTERNLEAARDAIQASKLSKEEKTLLAEYLPDLMVETPRTRSAIATMSAFLRDAAPELAVVMREVLGQIATEAVRKALGL